MCSPSRLVREITTFVRGDDDCWRRGDEQHVNVLMDTARIPRLLDPLGIDFTVGSSFGAESSTEGLVTIVGTRHPWSPSAGYLAAEVANSVTGLRAAGRVADADARA